MTTTQPKYSIRAVNSGLFHSTSNSATTSSLRPTGLSTCTLSITPHRIMYPANSVYLTRKGPIPISVLALASDPVASSSHNGEQQRTQKPPPRLGSTGTIFLLAKSFDTASYLWTPLYRALAPGPRACFAAEIEGGKVMEVRSRTVSYN